mgnify:CR=1 FL=1
MIVWLEDRIQTIGPELEYLKKREIKPMVLPTVVAFVDYLEEMAAEGAPAPRLFVLDVMIHGVHDLLGIGIRDAPTFQGTKTGYVFADRVLRKEDSPWRDTRIVFYTEAEAKHLREAAAKLATEDDALDCCVFQKYRDAQLTEFKALIEATVRE